MAGPAGRRVEWYLEGNAGSMGWPGTGLQIHRSVVGGQEGKAEAEMRQLTLDTSTLGMESDARTAQVTGDLEPHTKAQLGGWRGNGLERIAHAMWLVICENMTHMGRVGDAHRITYQKPLRVTRISHFQEKHLEEVGEKRQPFYPISLPRKHTRILVLERVSCNETPSTLSSMSNQGVAVSERRGQGRGRRCP